MKAALVAIVVVTQWIAMIQGYGEDFATGLPPYQTRAYQVLLNALRASPKQYVQQYASDYGKNINNTVYAKTTPASTGPLSLDSRLYSAGALLTSDIATKGCKFTSSLCNGTDYATRITYYYGQQCLGSGDGSVTELLSVATYSNFNDPRFVLANMLCGDSGASDCIADDNANAIYRFKLTSSAYVGGSAASARYTAAVTERYSYNWAVDLGSCSNPAGSSSIGWGSHFIDASNNLVFMAVWNAGSAPSSATVVIDNSTTPLALTNTLGTASLGAYTAVRSRFTDGCHSYYFQFQVAGATLRFPDTGLLWTYDTLNNCNVTFTGASKSSTSSTATTAAVNTGNNNGGGGATTNNNGGGGGTTAAGPTSTANNNGGVTTANNGNGGVTTANGDGGVSTANNGNGGVTTANNGNGGVTTANNGGTTAAATTSGAMKQAAQGVVCMAVVFLFLW